MRSETVVLPASMWAQIPRLRILVRSRDITVSFGQSFLVELINLRLCQGHPARERFSHGQDARTTFKAKPAAGSQRSPVRVDLEPGIVLNHRSSSGDSMSPPAWSVPTSLGRAH